jgi:hypothetical protein
MSVEDPCDQLERKLRREGNGFAGGSSHLSPPDETTECRDNLETTNWRSAQIREWLLMILRFAITRDTRDKMGVFGKADELDAVGVEWRPSAPSFFSRTSNEICGAIMMPDGPERTAILQRQFVRIDDVRLRRALQAAVGINGGARRSSRTRRRGLWDGLPG